jgi:hypothetical protein
VVVYFVEPPIHPGPIGTLRPDVGEKELLSHLPYFNSRPSPLWSDDKEQPVEYEKKPCPLCNDTGFVMETETDVGSEATGKPDIFLPKPCPNGRLPPHK